MIAALITLLLLWLRPYFCYIFSQFPRLSAGLADHDANGGFRDSRAADACCDDDRFANMFMPHGLAYAAGGASMGAGVGAFCALLVLMWFYGRLKQKLKADLQQQNPLATRESARAIISRLLRLALPVSMSSLMLPVVANLDLLIVPQRLEAAGFHISQATEFFGYLTGMAVPLINLATIFTAAMTISLVPAISESRALNDVFGIRAKTRTAFRVALIITCPCFVGMYFLAEK